MNFKWLAMAGLVAFPMLAEAECGWLLMVPPRVGPGLTLPLFSTWDQRSAYDSATSCEAYREIVALAKWGNARRAAAGKPPLPPVDTLIARVRVGEFEELEAEDQTQVRFFFGRCLPAMQVPLPK